MSRITTAGLGSYYLKYLLLWALVENQAKGAFAANIIKARVDANKDGIVEGLEHYAKEYGLTVEELTDTVIKMDKKGRSIPQIHKDLRGGGEDDPEAAEDED